MQDLVIKTLFFKPAKEAMETDLFVMWNNVFDLLQNKLVKIFLEESIKRKSQVRNNDFLKYLTSYMVDSKIDDIIDIKK